MCQCAFKPSFAYSSPTTFYKWTSSRLINIFDIPSGEGSGMIAEHEIKVHMIVNEWGGVGGGGGGGGEIV